MRDREFDLPERGRWLIVAGLAVLALPVTFWFFFFGLVAAAGCFGDCSSPTPRPLWAAGLALGAAVMGAAWAGLVPWALRRGHLVARTVAVAAGVLLGLFALLALLV